MRNQSASRLRALLALVVCASLGCGDATTRVATTEVRDSAGIRVVTNSRPVSDVPWTVDREPVVEIGGDESDTTQILFRVAGAVVLADGRIAVVQGPAPMLRWFDAAGEYLFGTGRPGGGPGEFGSGEGAWINAIWAVGGDSVATWEHSPRRMQVFDPSGQFVRRVVLDLPPAMPPGSYPQMVGPLDRGFVAFLTPPFEPGAVGEVTRQPIAYLRYRYDGSYAGEIARVPGFMYFTRMLRLPDGTEQRVPGRPPFSKQPAAWPGGDRLFYGSGESYEIAAYDTSGALTTLIRKTVGARPLTSDAIARHRAEVMAGAPSDPATRRQWEESVKTAPYPDSIPVYRRIRVDRGGMLWVQDYSLPGADSAPWSIFDGQGVWIADVAIPIEWELLDIGDDYLLVLVRDDLDIERIRRHTLDRH